jgi:hypothetical protein
MLDQNFNPFTNLHRICWLETLWLNFLRAVCVLPILILFTQGQNDVGFYISYPFAYTFLIAPMLIVLRLITFAIGGNLPMGKLFAHLIVLFMSVVFISGGDPILFLLNFISKKIKPDFTLVPIKKYPIFTPQLLIFVLKDDLIERNDYQENTESFEQTNDQQTEGNSEVKLSPACKSGMIKFMK